MIVTFLAFQISVTQSYYTITQTSPNVILSITDNQRLFIQGQTITGYLNFYVNLSVGTNTISSATITRLFFTTSYQQNMQITLTAQNYNISNQPGTNFIQSFANLISALALSGYYTTLELLVTPNYTVVLRNQQNINTNSNLTYTLTSSGTVNDQSPAITLSTVFSNTTSIPTFVLLLVNCTDIPVTIKQGVQSTTGQYQFNFQGDIAKSIQNYQYCGFLLFNSTTSTDLSLINMNVAQQFPSTRTLPMLYEYVFNTGSISTNVTTNISQSTITVIYNDQLGLLSQYFSSTATIILTDNKKSFQFAIQTPITQILQVQYSISHFGQLAIKTFEEAFSQIKKGNTSLALILQTNTGIIVPLTGEFRYKRDIISILQVSQDTFNNIQLNLAYNSTGITFNNSFPCVPTLTIHFYRKNENSSTSGQNQPFWSFPINLPQTTCKQAGTISVSLDQLRSTNMSAYYTFINSANPFYTFQMANGPQIVQYSSTFTNVDFFVQINVTAVVLGVIFALIIIVLIILLVLWLLGIIGNRASPSCDCCVGCCWKTQKLTRSKMVLSMRPKGIRRSLRLYQLKRK